MPERIMSDAEFRRRRKLQGKIGRTTSALGLTGAGLGVAALATKNPSGRVLRSAEKVPGLRKVTHEGLKEGALYTGITAGGIGGVGGFNQAKIYSAESRKRKQSEVAKGLSSMDMGYFGEEGRPLTHKEIEAEIEKAWTPSASNFDSERDRHKRSVAYDAASLGVAGVGGAYAGHHGVQAVKHARKIKGVNVRASRMNETEVTTKKKNRTTGEVVESKHNRVAPVSEGKIFRAVGTKHFRPTAIHGAKAAAGAAVLGGALGAGAYARKKHASDWQPYAKRDSVSAFGVDHNDDLSGQHRETEN